MDIDIKAFPGIIKGETAFLKYHISFCGDIYELEKTFAAKRRQENIKKQEGVVKVKDSHLTRSTNEIPATVKQNIFHPFQGDRVSPK